jgi:hypothetical protein
MVSKASEANTIRREKERQSSMATSSTVTASAISISDQMKQVGSFPFHLASHSPGLELVLIAPPSPGGGLPRSTQRTLQRYSIVVEVG